MQAIIEEIRRDIQDEHDINVLPFRPLARKFEGWKSKKIM
jgi:hypothetical protein